MTRGLWALGALLSMVITVYAAGVLLVPGFGSPFVADLRGTSFVPLVAHLAGGLVALGVGPWTERATLEAGGTVRAAG